MNYISKIFIISSNQASKIIVAKNLTKLLLISSITFVLLLFVFYNAQAVQIDLFKFQVYVPTDLL